VHLVGFTTEVCLSLFMLCALRLLSESLRVYLSIGSVTFRTVKRLSIKLGTANLYKNLRFFKLGSRWGWMVNATPRPLYYPHPLHPRKTQYPYYRSLGGFQGRSVRVQKISLPPDRLARSEALYRLSYPSPHLWTDFNINLTHEYFLKICQKN
jgi:hypothetical protein